MTVLKSLRIIVLLPVLASPAAAQNVQLRGLPQPGSSLLPSAQQQLNQNLNRQTTNFNVQRQIDRANRLNRMDHINRLSVQRNLYNDPCAGAKSACKPK